MNTPAKPIPDGYEGATPYLCCQGAAQALEFYKQAFGAVETMRMPGPDGKLGHAEFKIGKAIIMLADEYPEMGVVSPKTLSGTAVGMLVYFENVDAVLPRAVAAGATILRPLADQFYGDRSCTVLDPYGHRWTLATHIRDMSPEEMATAAAAAMGEKKQCEN